MKSDWFPIVLGIVIVIVITNGILSGYKEREQENKAFEAYLAGEPVDTVWRGDNQYQIPAYCDSGRLIRYGRELIANTAYYLGPKGIVAHITNGMNCQNCHLDGGTVPFANNFGKVCSTYPQYRARNDGIQSIYGRVNDCFERSLNGAALDSNSREMKAIYAYIRWLDDGIPRGAVPGGTILKNLKYLDSAANPLSGKQVYIAQCLRCHGENGQGLADAQGIGYSYPPLWGEHSYNDGAGLYRIGSFAAYVKSNMPFGVDYHQPALTDEEAWDVAAYVNSQPRPHMDQRGDWKKIAAKPVDFPFGPYADAFSENQHKFGPFLSIQAAKKTK